MSARFNALTRLWLLACFCIGAIEPRLSDAVEETDQPKLLLTIPTNRNGKFDLITVDLEGKNPQQLTTDPRGAMEPTWSPDGKRIAFVSFRTGIGQIFVMNADGSELKNITNTSTS
jgi:Tol biopolymer transport system component